MVNVPELVFSSDSGLSCRNSYVEPQCRNQERYSGTIQDRQDATIKLIRGVGVPRTVFWHASGSSNGCLPTRLPLLGMNP
eukprot:4082328-Pyramimonas_sp.AAC.1